MNFIHNKPDNVYIDFKLITLQLCIHINMHLLHYVNVHYMFVVGLLEIVSYVYNL